MVSQLPLLALGVVISVGVAFLFWTLYHLAWDAHANGPRRRGRQANRPHPRVPGL